MDKRKLIYEIQVGLAQELAHLVDAAKAAREAATNDESRAEDQYDTRALEASYLAGAEAQRAAEIQKQLLLYKFLPIRDYGADDPIVPGSLVEMELNRRVAWYFMVPQGGGLVAQVDGVPVQVITANSPLGDAILGRKQGETVEIEVRDGVREYKILEVK